MQQLPTMEEQQWLIDSLGALIAQRGPDHFVSWPIVEPTRKYFPDPWSFDLQGVDRVTRRLAQYSDLADLEIAIVPFAEGTPLDDPGEVHRQRTVAGLFLGIEAGVARFGFNALSPSDGEHAAGIMAHEVAHAYRARHGLMRPQADDEEELLTDLTTVYLGLGILAANNSCRYRTEGGLNYQAWSTMAAGYLPPQAFAFLLGLQVVVRGLDGGARHRVVTRLEANQAGFLQTAVQLLEPQAEALLERLGLAPRSAWPPARSPSDLLRPLPDFVPPPETQDSSAPENASPDEPWPVFRRSRTRATFFVTWFTLCGLLAGMAAGVASESPGWILIGPLGFVGGWVWGRRTRFDVCSDSQCGSVLAPGVSVCPGCGGQVAGRIRSQRELLEAEDAFFQSQKAVRRHARRRRARAADPEG